MKEYIYEGSAWLCDTLKDKCVCSHIKISTYALSPKEALAHFKFKIKQQFHIWKCRRMDLPGDLRVKN